MSIEATADALAAHEAAPVEVSMEAELGAVFDKLTAEPENAPTPEPETAPVEQVEAVEEPEAAEPVEEVEVPSGLPVELRDKWKAIPTEARDAILKDRDGLNRKLSDMGRQVQGIAPIRDSLVKAVEKFPFLADMKPQDVAQQIFQLADVGQKLRENPGAMLAQLAKQHGAEQALLQHLQGQPQTQQAAIVPKLLNQIQQLEQKLARVADPEYLSQQITQVTTQQQVVSSVNEFASQAEHWSDVETHIPTYIQIAKAKLGETAAPKALLEFAYTKAVQDFVEKAPSQPAEEATLAPDPDRTAKALKAVSVNVNGKATGKPRPLTEEEALSAVYDRAAKR
jgi:hypothetical protein